MSIDSIVVRWPPGRIVDLAARAQHAAGDLAGVAAVVVVLVAHRPDHPLHRETHLREVAIGGDHHVLEVVEQRCRSVPVHVARAVDDVVTVEGRDRDERDIRDLEPGRPVGQLVDDVVEDLLVVADEVHLVHAEDQVRDPQQRRDVGVAPGLLADALARIHEHDRQVGGRGAGDHVPGVLLVAGRVGDDELAPRSGEVPVGDVDRDPLLALGSQPVSEQRQVQVAVAAALGGQLDVLELVLEDRLGVVKQAADQRRLAVVDRACGGDPQQLAHPRPGHVPVCSSDSAHGSRSSLRACGLPWPLR